MKPTRRIMCPDCGKQKMLFETEKKAQGFIKWNADEIPHGEDLRAYYCPSCCGWHISHKQHWEGYDTNTERLIGAFERSRKTTSSVKKIDKLIHYDIYQRELMKQEEHAVKIYRDIPPEIRREGKKSLIKRYLDNYYKGNAVDDKSGRLRGLVYKLWEKDMSRLKQ